MPSWNDGETSSESWLGDYPEVDYAPETIADPAWTGLADPESAPRCRMHDLLPEKAVAFEGTSTGRRFYVCSKKTDGINYGFVGWADPQWSLPCQRALTSLWGMYENNKSSRNHEKIQNDELVKNLIEEKSKVEEKYISLVADVNHWMDAAEKRALEQNMAKLKKNCEDDSESESRKMEKERNLLLEEKKIWEDEKKKLKEEKKLEYTLFDLLKVGDANKDKLKKIRQICDE